MSFSRLLQNAPYYSPAAFSPNRRRQQEGPSALARARRARAARPLVDPYATLTAPEFDNFVDDVSSRIVSALTYEPNKDRRIRRGYADDEEYWMEMGGRPGEFVGAEAEEEVVDEVMDPVNELESDALQTHDTVDGSLEDLDDMETREALEEYVDDGVGPARSELEQDQSPHLDAQAVNDAASLFPDSPIFPANVRAHEDGPHAQAQRLYPDLSNLSAGQSFPAAVPDAGTQDIVIPSHSLYPPLAELQQETAPPVTVNEDYQLDLLRQFTHEGYDGYAVSSQELQNTNMQSIEDLLSMAEKDAEEANEAIRHIQEEDEKEQQLDEALLEELEHAAATEEDERSEQAAHNADILIAEEESSESGSVRDMTTSNLKSPSREASDVISIGSTSEEEEEESEEEEVNDDDNEPLDLEEEEEAEEDSDVEITPPPVAGPSAQAAPSRELFGQLDAPIASQARLMSQKLRRRMDEDDLRTSDFDEEDAPMASGSSDASEEHAREWQQFRRKAGRGQRAQDEQDAADRYFDDEEENEERRLGSDEEDHEDSDDEDSDDEERSPDSKYSRLHQRAAEREFEDELDDEAVANEEREAERMTADLDDRVPIPAFMKRDRETGEYDLRIGSSDEDSEGGSEDDAFEQDALADDVQIEILDDEDVSVQVEQDIQVGPVPGVDVVVGAEDDAMRREATSEVLDPTLLPGTSDENLEIDIIEEQLDLTQTDESLLPEGMRAQSTPQAVDINQLIMDAMGQGQPTLADFASVPPLPQGLADVAEQLVQDAIEAVHAAVADDLDGDHDDVAVASPAHTGIADIPVLDTESELAHEGQPPSQRPFIQETKLPASTPRKSTEPKLFSSMAVSPEQFSLPKRQSTPSVPQEMPVEAVAPNVIVPEEVTLPAVSTSDPVPGITTAIPEENRVPDLSTSTDAVMIVGDSTPGTTDSQPDSALLEQDSTIAAGHEAAEQSVVGGSNEVSGPRMPSEASHFTEDHHHEPPPPELQVEEHFAHPHRPNQEEEAMVGIDLTTDEMESHSADEAQDEGNLAHTAFTEDHHHEPPPPELQEGSDDLIGHEVALESEPLAGIDMTTDEMEQHSADEGERGPVHEIGYKEEHIFEPVPLPSESLVDDEQDVEDVALAPEGTTVPEDKEDDLEESGAAVSEQASKAPEASIASVSQGEADNGATALQSEPSGDLKTADARLVPAQETSTPTRAFNVIKPGLWDPSTPIRFGGTSLEAAVREAYYDPERSANLRESLGEEQEQKDQIGTTQEVEAAASQSAKQVHARFDIQPEEEKDFVPLDVASDGDIGADGEAAKETEAKESTEDELPARISSPGIKQADGNLTKTVLEADFIGDTVTDVLAEDSELPPLEPEVLASIETSDYASSKDEEASASAAQSSSSIVEYEELVNDPQATTSQARVPVAVEDLLSSSDESDDHDHVAASLLRSRAPHTATGKTLSKARRGRSRTRRTPSASRKGKERASPEHEAEVEMAIESEDTGYISSSSSEGENLIRVTSKRARSMSTKSSRGDSTSRERAVTPQKDNQGRNIVTTVVVPGSPIDPTTPMEEMEVTAMLAPRPSKPRLHRHGASGSRRMLSPPARRRRGSVSSKSSSSRPSAEPVLPNSPAPVHPDPEHPSHATSEGHGGSPIQTRSQCTYRKLMIPNPYLGSINTPGRRISTRLARAAGEAANESPSQDFPSSFVFLVPGCVTADRKEQMQEGGIVDLGVASVEEEGSAMALQTNEDNETGLHVEGLPDSIVQSLVRVVGLEMFREGDCEILSPLIPAGSGSPARNGNGNGTERKRRRESDMMSPPASVKRLR